VSFFSDCFASSALLRGQIALTTRTPAHFGVGNSDAKRITPGTLRRACACRSPSLYACAPPAYGPKAPVKSIVDHELFPKSHAHQFGFRFKTVLRASFPVSSGSLLARRCQGDVRPGRQSQESSTTPQKSSFWQSVGKGREALLCARGIC
jgi:hypothetical protein